MKKIKILIIIILIVILLILVPFIIKDFKRTKVTHDFKSINLDGYNKLMIVAHPDDEMIWGGSRLITDDYLVVCITCGSDLKRVDEIDTVLKETNDKLIILGYPDKTNGKRDEWESCKEDIIKDLESIVSLKDWDLIVTHNPDGEYGHIHHIMTSALVTDKVVDKDNLYYFGKYHSKKKIGSYINEMGTIDNELLDEKIKILKLYKSQSFIMVTFDHMFEHEDWVSYKEWQEGA